MKYIFTLSSLPVSLLVVGSCISFVFAANFQHHKDIRVTTHIWVKRVNVEHLHEGTGGSSLL